MPPAVSFGACAFCVVLVALFVARRRRKPGAEIRPLQPSDVAWAAEQAYQAQITCCGGPVQPRRPYHARRERLADLDERTVERVNAALRGRHLDGLLLWLADMGVALADGGLYPDWGEAVAVRTVEEVMSRMGFRKRPAVAAAGRRRLVRALRARDHSAAMAAIERMFVVRLGAAPFV